MGWRRPELALRAIGNVQINYDTFRTPMLRGTSHERSVRHSRAPSSWSSRGRVIHLQSWRSGKGGKLSGSIQHNPPTSNPYESHPAHEPRAGWVIATR